jgi:hypothetical protein
MSYQSKEIVPYPIYRKCLPAARLDNWLSRLREFAHRVVLFAPICQRLVNAATLLQRAIQF